MKREDADISAELVKGIKLKVPIISAPMQSVTELEMAEMMHHAGGFGIIHRFMPVKDQVTIFEEERFENKPILWMGAAIGINEGYDRWEKLYEAGCRIFCLDIAHAHHDLVEKFIKGLPDHLVEDKTYLIAGNVATANGAIFLKELGVDGIKVGIGPGAACSTREVTGFGVPQLTAIMECVSAINGSDVTVIADGGIRSSGDIVKAIAAGADTVMVGRLLAGADESPHPGLYWGMASKKVNSHWAPEGIEGVVPRTGSVENTVKQLAWGIRSGVSYGGARNLQELRDYAEFIRVTPMSMSESSTRL